MSGRTSWVPKDSGWHRRGRIVELGQEHGGAGVNAMDWMMCEARVQNQLRDGKGDIKIGYAAIAHGAFIASFGEARAIVKTCVRVGLLDDFEELDERTFRARVSGWHADVNLTLEAARKAEERAAKKALEALDKDGHSGTNGTVVPACPETSPKQQEQEGKNSTVEPARLDDARERIQGEQVQRVFDEWVTATSRTGRTVLDAKRRRRITAALKTYPLDDVLAAVRGWKNSPHHRGENASSTVYNDLDLLLRDGEHIERFRDLDAGTSGAASESPSERAARFNARYGDSAA